MNPFNFAFSPSRTTQGAILLGVFLSAGVFVSCEEAFNNVDSRITCSDYCAKKANCANENPTNEETRSCVNSCRDNIEDNCGNEHQAAANNALGNCNDVACGEFAACMVFEVAPECFAFARN